MNNAASRDASEREWLSYFSPGPQGVATAQARPEERDHELYPEELASLERAPPKRRAEFGSVRVCARQALSQRTHPTVTAWRRPGGGWHNRAVETQAQRSDGDASLAGLLLFGGAGLGLGLPGGEPGAREQLGGAAGGPVCGDLVEDVDQVVEGIDVGEGALEHEREQDGIALAGLEAADEEAVLAEDGDSADETLDVGVGDGQVSADNIENRG